MQIFNYPLFLDLFQIQKLFVSKWKIPLSVVHGKDTATLLLVLRSVKSRATYTVLTRFVV